MKSLALLTGAASGLGLEFSRLLAADSYDLFLVDINQKGLEEIKVELEEGYGIVVEVLVEDLG